MRRGHCLPIVSGAKKPFMPQIDPLGTFRVHQDMICTRDVIEAVSLGLVLAPVFVRGIAIMPDRKDNITSFSGGLPFGRTMFSFL